MASFQKHKSKSGITTWRVQLFVNGRRDSRGGFDSKSEAKIWAATREAEILGGKAILTATPQPLTPETVFITYKTLGDVFDRYSSEVSPTKAGAHWEKIRFYSFSRSPFANTPLPDLGRSVAG